MRILELYLTGLSVILAGVFNMLFTKTGFYKRHKSPIDRGYCLSDGKRLFGDNKTWVGFLSMIVLCTVLQLLCGALSSAAGWDAHNDLYRVYGNTPLYNLLIGFLFGLAYAVFELPNSFIKRRLNIEPGKTKKSLVGALFFGIDQIDSMIGVVLIIYLFSDIPPFGYFEYLLMGGVGHALINAILYLVKIRRNI